MTSDKNAQFKNLPVPSNGNVNAPSTPDGQNFQCPACGCRRASTLETRRTEFRGHFFVMRVRLCEYCGYHYRTKEVTVQEDEAPRKQRSSPQEKWDGGPIFATKETPLADASQLDEDIERQKQEPPREFIPGEEPPPRKKAILKKTGRRKKGEPKITENTPIFPEIDP